MWGPDPATVPIEVARRHFLMAITGFIAFGFLVKAITQEPPAIRREYPFDGLVKELGGVEENKVSDISVFLLSIHIFLVRLGLKISIVRIRDCRVFGRVLIPTVVRNT